MTRLAALLLAAAAACSRPDPPIEEGATSDAGDRARPEAPARASADIVALSYRAMGTQVRFVAWTDAPDRARGAFEAAIVEFRRLEELHSNWKPQSDVSRINARAGVKPVRVAPETVALLTEAKRMHSLTSGKFDVGFGALAKLWRFDHDQDNRIPDRKAVAAQLPLVDASRIQVDAERSTVFLPEKGMSVHVGGIGKGFAVDRAARLLRARGLENFMIQAGGDLYAAGRRGDRPWRVGIRDPRGPPSAFFARAEIEDRTFSTSGDYMRFFIKDGVRYHHIIDPDSGEPARRCRSVTVFAPSALVADAFSTGVFILGVDEGLALVEATPGVGAVIVDADNEVHVSKRLTEKVELINSPTL